MNNNGKTPLSYDPENGQPIYGYDPMTGAPIYDPSFDPSAARNNAYGASQNSYYSGSGFSQRTAVSNMNPGSVARGLIYFFVAIYSLIALLGVISIFSHMSLISAAKRFWLWLFALGGFGAFIAPALMSAGAVVGIRNGYSSESLLSAGKTVSMISRLAITLALIIMFAEMKVRSAQVYLIVITFGLLDAWSSAALYNAGVESGAQAATGKGYVDAKPFMLMLIRMLFTSILLVFMGTFSLGSSTRQLFQYA